MRWLMVADFLPNRASGAAGTLMALGEALETMGDGVAHCWQPSGLAFAGTARDRFVDLGRRQFRQVRAALAARPADVVTVSQPWAWRVFRDLAPQHPRTMFLNRTHGWEARLYAHQRRFGWDRHRGPAGRAASRFGELLTQRSCRKAAQYAHGVVTACRRDAEFIRAQYGLSDDRVAAIAYGADDIPPASGTRSGPLRVLFVGHYRPEKGAGVTARILPGMANRDSRTHLTFVTTPDAVAAVRQDHQAWGDRLVVEPWLDRLALAERYRAHDIVLFPSLFEGFGKTWLEAMRAGCCVVGFAEGGLPDVATTGHDALFAPTGDEVALAALLAQALGDPVGTRRIGTAAARRAVEFTWARTADATRTWVLGLRATVRR